MLGRITAWIAIKALKSVTLRGEGKIRVTNALLNNIGSLPLRSTITFDEFGTITLNGKALEPDQAVNFRESCRGMQDSWARKLIHEQVRFLAINMGVHNGLTPESIMFAKAALWYAEQENDLLRKVLGE